jgi:glutathionylspermidine synthase
MLAEPYGRVALAPGAPTTWIEPAWKLLLSNKALLAVLWELFPDHPYLLPAFLDGPRGMREYVAKPLLGREGASMRLVTAAGELTTEGIYGDEGFCYQQFRALPEFDGNYMVLGSWVVAGEAAGAGLRETRGLVTDNLSRFLPHYLPTPREA